MQGPSRDDCGSVANEHEAAADDHEHEGHPDGIEPAYFLEQVIAGVDQRQDRHEQGDRGGHPAQVGSLGLTPVVDVPHHDAYRVYALDYQVHANDIYVNNVEIE